jgi:hypothetical protein
LLGLSPGHNSALAKLSGHTMIITIIIESKRNVTYSNRTKYPVEKDWSRIPLAGQKNDHPIIPQTKFHLSAIIRKRVFYRCGAALSYLLVLLRATNNKLVTSSC